MKPEDMAQVGYDNKEERILLSPSQSFYSSLSVPFALLVEHRYTHAHTHTPHNKDHAALKRPPSQTLASDAKRQKSPPTETSCEKCDLKIEPGGMAEKKQVRC